MKLMRLDETNAHGKSFAHWLRDKLLACGDATERTERLARGELRTYVIANSNFDRGTGGDEASLIGGFRIAPSVNGNEHVATLVEVEPYLFDGERSLAAVCDANGAVLVAAPVWRAGVALHKGDYCTVLSAADVREELGRCKHENADGGEN